MAQRQWQCAHAQNGRSISFTSSSSHVHRLAYNELGSSATCASGTRVSGKKALKSKQKMSTSSQCESGVGAGGMPAQLSLNGASTQELNDMKQHVCKAYLSRVSSTTADNGEYELSHQHCPKASPDYCALPHSQPRPHAFSGPRSKASA